MQSHGLILDTITPHEHGVKRFEQAPDSIRGIERLERFERASQMSPSDETE